MLGCFPGSWSAHLPYHCGPRDGYDLFPAQEIIPQMCLVEHPENFWKAGLVSPAGERLRKALQCSRGVESKLTSSSSLVKQILFQQFQE